MMSEQAAKQTLRVLRYLECGKLARIAPFNDGKKVRTMISLDGSKPIVVPSDCLDSLYKASLIDLAESTVKLTAEGKRRLRRAVAVANGATDNGYQSQHQNVDDQTITVDGAQQAVKMNLDESPLLRLSLRKMKSGEPWIDAAAFEAGERLRMDFTRGQLMQKTTSSWDATMGTTSRKGGAGGKIEIGDSAIDARNRLYQALDVVGPELAGVLTDICCFLKGFELVERERKWPPRSAKLMVRIGLDLLARHYGTIAGQGRRSTGRILATP